MTAAVDVVGWLYSYRGVSMGHYANRKPFRSGGGWTEAPLCDANAATAREAALVAQVEALRRRLKDCPSRTDYATDKSFVDAHRNWEFEGTRAALEAKP